MSGAAALAVSTSVDFEVNTIEIKLPNLPPQFHNYRIGFVSDLHLGPWMLDQMVIDAFEALYKRSIDLLVLGGDYILIPESLTKYLFGDWRNHSFGNLGKRELAQEVFKRFAKYATAHTPKDGVIAVFGNHDRWNHPTACQHYFEEAGIKLLTNSRLQIKRGNASLDIVGIEDFLTGIPKWPDQAAANIVISHNPDGISDLLRRSEGRFDLAICGHTHGGQICFPVIGAVWPHIFDLRFIQGLVRVGATQVFTSRGLGVVGVPFRLDCPAEVNIIELRGI